MHYQEVESIESSEVAKSVELSDVEETTEPERSRHVPLPKRPLLPQYAHLTKQQAVEQVMREHSGSIVTRNTLFNLSSG